MSMLTEDKKMEVFQTEASRKAEGVLTGLASQAPDIAQQQIAQLTPFQRNLMAKYAQTGRQQEEYIQQAGQTQQDIAGGK